MKIAGVGLSCIDVYENLNRYYPTGNSVDFLIHMSRLGVQTSIVSVVGNDSYGRQMEKVLKREKVGVSHLHVAEGDTAMFKMDLKKNDRVHKEKLEGVMSKFSLTEDDILFIQEHDYIHSNFSGRVTDSLPVFKKYGLSTIFDYSTRVNKDARLTLPNVDYAFFSYDQDDNFIRDYIVWAYEFGPRLVIVTFGEKGSLAYDGKTFYEGGIVPSRVVNTVGAGDSFCAGFMYGIIHNHEIHECLRMGAKVASEVVGMFEPY